MTDAGSQAGVFSDATVYTADITRYFNPEEYAANQYQNAITLSYDLNYLTSEQQYVNYRDVSLESITFFQNKFLDMSKFTLYAFDTAIKNYNVKHSSDHAFSNIDNEYHNFVLIY